MTDKKAAAAAETKEAPKVSIGRIVHITAGEDHPGHDGERTAAAVVTKVNDDGSINARIFAPNGGADTFITGVRSKADVDAMEDGADKNSASSNTWDWPERV